MRKNCVFSVNARFLWKRIPHSVKSANVELEKIYTVYNFLWHNNIAGFFKAINHEWSNTVAELMFELKGKFSLLCISSCIFKKNVDTLSFSFIEKTYKETLDLIGKAYTSIFEDRVCELLNQTPDAIDELCKNLEWEIQAGDYPRLILPRRPVPVKVSTESSEHLLAKLTDFVSFLEN